MVRHGRAYWWLVGIAVAVGLVVLATIAAPLVRRGWGGNDAKLRATQDTLIAERTNTAEAIRQMRVRDQILMQANATLDSLLRQPPKVVYVRRAAPNRPAELLGDTLRPDLPSGDTLDAYVPLPAYEDLATGCREAESACDGAKVARDTIIARQARTIATQGSIIVQKDQQAKREHRANIVGRVRDTGLGIGIGALLQAVFGK